MTKKISLITLSLLLIIFSNAQKKEIFEKVEIEAGTNEKAWMEHITKKTQLPDSAVSNIPSGAYSVNVRFIIDKDGNIGQVKAKNDPGYGLAQRAEKIISTYTGTWRPAIQCGRFVMAYRTQLITFVIPALITSPGFTKL